jgi:hypothetical protein
MGMTRADRVMAIAGASHKAYCERYLGMTSDVELGQRRRAAEITAGQPESYKELGSEHRCAVV